MAQKTEEDLLKLALRELKRCKEDPTYFICNYIKVVHPVRGLVPFELYPFQKRILVDFNTHRFNVLRKFRQAGCTTLSCAYALWFCLFNPKKTVAVLSKGDAESTEFLDRIKIMHDELPPFLKQELSENNKHTLRFSNKSTIRSRASGKQSGRSLAGSLLILDEAAFIENMKTIWAAALPSISTGGKVIVLSTVNGIANWFFEIYSGAIKKTNSFHPIDITWKEHPEYFRHPEYQHLYDEMMQRQPPKDIDLWEKEMRGNLKPKEWKQEFEAAFLGTGETYIDGETLEQLVANTSNEFYERYDGRLRIWKPPIPGRIYVLAADCSLGRGYDNSAFHVLDVATGNQVAEFYSDSTPINEFSKIIAIEGFRYNTANVIVERNTIGFILIQQLLETHEYDNVWFDEKGEPGIMINQKNREQLLGVLEENLRLGRIKINSDRTSYELLTFIINDTTHKPEADEGKTDDLVMSLAFAVEATKLIPFVQEIENVKEEFKPMGIMLANNSRYTLRLRLPHGGIVEEDYSWILSN